MSEPGSRRGRTHDAEGAREAILNAAEEVFAEHGFDGARVDAIAAAAGYNKSLIFQYFGDKLGLYASLLKRSDDRTRYLQAEALEMANKDQSFFQPDKFKPTLKLFMGRLFDFFQENPRLIKIFLWEMADGWKTYLKVVPEIGLEDVETFGPFVERFHAEGLLKSDFSPVTQVIVAEFMLMVYLTMTPLLGLFNQNEDFDSQESLNQAREFLTNFIVDGLVADPHKPKSSGD